MATSSSSSKISPKPECKYGLLCQRRNSEHWDKFCHPTTAHHCQREETNQQQGTLSVDFEEQSRRIYVKSEEQQKWCQEALSHSTINVHCKSNHVLLMLVGLPGSGKSTFCNKLVQNNPSKWRRICQAAMCGLRPEKFKVIAGDITKLQSGCGLHCNFIANATNWRLKPGGGGVNASIYKAAGEDLEIETKKRAKTLTPGSALVVPLPPTSPLRVTEGVTHIIHVLGPNMNPQRPNCLQGDYVEGSKLLRDAYSCMFQAFASHVEPLWDNSISQSSGLEKAQSSRNAFSVLMQSAKRKLIATDSGPKAKRSGQGAGQEGTGITEKNRFVGQTVNGSDFREPNNVGRTELSSPNKIIAGEVEAQRQSFSLVGSGSSRSKHWEPWAEALWKMVQHPEHLKDTILQVTDEAIVINDKFPKAKRHLLVVSRLDGLDSIEELRSSHLSLLQNMHSLGMTFVHSLLQHDDSLVFRMGYHSEPSIRQLHMHIISQDFNSPSLKNKKHWNSFTTTFFRDSKGVIEELKETGRVKPVGDESSLLKIELRCHRCRSVQPNIPRLKQHIDRCQAPLSPDLMEKEFLIMANKDRT